MKPVFGDQKNGTCVSGAVSKKAEGDRGSSSTLGETVAEETTVGRDSATNDAAMIHAFAGSARWVITILFHGTLLLWSEK